MLVDSVTDLILFTRIVKEGSLCAAGRESGMSSAAVTKRLQRLEERLGVRLVNRSTRKLSVTDEGAQYYEYCLLALAQLEEAETVITQQSRQLRGRLKVSLPAYFGRKYIVPLIPDFLQRHRKLQLSLNLSDGMVDIIESGCDVAVRISNMKDSNLVAAPLGIEHRVVVATPRYLAVHGEPRTPEELSEHNALLYANPSPLDTWTFIDRDGATRCGRVSGNFETDSCESLNGALHYGLGIALRPTWDIVEDVRTGKLKILLPDYTPPSYNIQAVYPSKQHLSIKVRIFIDLLRDSIKSRRFSASGVCPNS